MSREDKAKQPVTINNVTIEKLVIYDAAPGSAPQENSTTVNTIASQDVDLLKIYKVRIPGSKDPVLHPDIAEVGVSLGIIDEKGLITMIVDPWQNPALRDRCSLLLNDSEEEIVGEFIETLPAAPIELGFPASLLSEGINRLRVKVKRDVQPEPERSEFLRVLFHPTRPGGEVAGSGDNLNLTLTLPADVIANGVDAARAAQGVDVTLRYPYMREHDTLTLDLDGRLKPHTVNAAEAAAREVRLTLGTADFWQDNTKFAIRYRVVDQLDNRSGPLAIWSKATYIDVHIKAPSLDLLPPKVLEARESNGTVMNFEKDFYRAPSATAEVNYPGSAPGQTVKVYWVGRNSTYGSEIQTVASAGQTLRFQVPRVEVIDCIHTDKNKVWYTVRLPGTDKDIPSQVLPLSIIGQTHKLGEPTYDSKTRKLTAVHTGLEAPYTVRMRLHGVVTHDGPEMQVSNAPNSVHTVEQAWIDENRGRTIMLNFSMRRTHSSDPINFSWCLRMKV